MAIAINDKVLFLHLPRTAGTFVSRLLRERWDVERIRSRRGAFQGHFLLSHYQDLSRYRFIFCFVRHPITWAQSIWKFLMARRNPWYDFRKMRRGRWHPWQLFLDCQAPCFDSWINRIMDEQPGLFNRMVEWYIGPEGCNVVDFVGRFESLHEDVHQALTLAKLDDVPSVEEIACRGVAAWRHGEVPRWQAKTANRFEDSERVLIKRFWG